VVTLFRATRLFNLFPLTSNWPLENEKSIQKILFSCVFSIEIVQKTHFFFLASGGVPVTRSRQLQLLEQKAKQTDARESGRMQRPRD
jgi:hypothetical protein